MNPDLQKALDLMFEHVAELLKFPDLKRIGMKGIPGLLPVEPSATYTKDQVIAFWRLAVLFNDQWKQSADLQPASADGKQRSWRKPNVIQPKPKPESTGEGRKPWTTEEKARMALLRKMQPGDRDLDMVVDRLYNGKDFDWFVANYDELNKKKEK